MPADFPSTPTLNQTYTFGGRTWTWNGTGWQLVANSTDKLTLTDGLVVPAASAATPSVRFTGSLSTGVYSPGTDQVAISTGGTGRIFVDSTGALGLNTSTSTIFSIGRLVLQNESTTADSRFIVAANAYLSGPTYTGTYIQQGDTATTGSTFGLSAANLGRLIFQNTSAGLIGCNGGVPLVFATSGTERFRVDASGRLGLGTSAPSYELDVAGSGTRTIRVVTTDTTGTAIGRFIAVYTGSGASATSTELRTGDSYGYLATTTNHPLLFGTNGTERFRCDSSGRLLVGTSTARSTQFFQMEGPGYEGSSSRYTRYSNDALSGGVILAKTRGTTAGSNTIVAADDRLGRVEFQGTDGAGLITAANIDCFVDGTPGTNSMPGRIVLSTTASGASSPTEQWRINNAGTVIYNQPAPAAVDTSATLTVANMTAKIITSTTAAAVTMTLPTGTNMDAGFSGLYTNMAFEWYVINTGGTNAVTVAANTAHTIVGSGTVSANNSGKFLSRRTAATTWVTYRLSS